MSKEMRKALPYFQYCIGNMSFFLNINFSILTEGQKAVTVTKIQKSLHLLDALSIDNGGYVQFGGWWKPEHCRPRSHVSVC